MGIEEFQFKAGQSGGPGRPKGSRNRLSKAFLESFAAGFEQHGTEVIKIVRVERPHEYLKVAAYLMPKAFDDEMPARLVVVTGVPRANDLEPAITVPQLPSEVTPKAPQEPAPVTNVHREGDDA